MTAEPEPHLGGRRLHCPRGKGLGGSSSINGLVYVRGNPLDFDRWESEGARGLGLCATCCPISAAPKAGPRAATHIAASDGPLKTRYGTLANPLYRAFIEAARAGRLSRDRGHQRLQQEGFGRMDMTVHRGIRWSAASAYLRPAMKRPNLAVRTKALATAHSCSRGAAPSASPIGAAASSRRSRRAARSSSRAAPINSPQLLKLSGIGPAAELRAHGIEVVRDLPGVGENLQDHLEFYFQVACKEPITLYSSMGPWRRA